MTLLKTRTKKMIPEVDNILPISTTTSEFFKDWLEFIKPVHKLTEREQDVTAAFLRKRFELSEKINDPQILDQVLFSDKTKKKIMEEVGISVPHFQMLMGKLRKAGVIVSNTLNPKIVPILKREANDFKLLVYFEIKNEG